MTVRVAINGFGRIGRNVVRALYESGRRAEITVVAINELADAAGMAHLLKYDTSHGRFAWEVRQERDQLFVGDDAIRVLHERSLQSLPCRPRLHRRIWLPRAWRSAYCRRGQKSALFTSWQ